MPRAATRPRAPAFPPSLGACADRLAELRDERLALQRQVEELATREQALREHVLAALPAGDGGAVGQRYKVLAVPKVVPRVTDWDALYRYVGRTRSYELLQRRAADAAIKERWDARKVVPGVEAVSVLTLSLTKV